MSYISDSIGEPPLPWNIVALTGEKKENFGIQYSFINFLNKKFKLSVEPILNCYANDKIIYFTQNSKTICMSVQITRVEGLVRKGVSILSSLCNTDTLPDNFDPLVCQSACVLACYFSNTYGILFSAIEEELTHEIYSVEYPPLVKLVPKMCQHKSDLGIQRSFYNNLNTTSYCGEAGALRDFQLKTNKILINVTCKTNNEMVYRRLEKVNHTFENSFRLVAPKKQDVPKTGFDLDLSDLSVSVRQTKDLVTLNLSEVPEKILLLKDLEEYKNDNSDEEEYSVSGDTASFSNDS